jgi:NAD(P)-dependent dehydrogenase (short-subunit alcohol dehydrogenase family)
MDMSERLAGRVALVTGGGGGIGRGIGEELARAGARVAVNDVSPAAADAAVEHLASLGAEAFAVPGDVGSASAAAAAIDAVLARAGRLDILVNNAGIQTWSPLLEVREADWDRVLDTNLKGCFLMTQAAARRMQASGGGVVVNIGSGCNRVPFPGLVAYTASKGGIEMLTKLSAVELGPSGIRVNCIAPGAIEVERTRKELPDYAGTWGRLTPLRRIGYPADIGRAVVFLASDESSFITGQTINVDGGLFSQPPWPSGPPA